MHDDTILTQEREACARIVDLSEQFGTHGTCAAGALRAAPALLPHHLARLDDILEQMRRQALRLRACQLQLTVVQGGLKP